MLIALSSGQQKKTWNYLLIVAAKSTATYIHKSDILSNAFWSVAIGQAMLIR